MGYATRVQEIKWPDFNQYYINFTRVLIKAMNFEKGEVFEWEVVDRDMTSMKRSQTIASLPKQGVCGGKSVR
jgi:hypothetical protein